MCSVGKKELVTRRKCKCPVFGRKSAYIHGNGRGESEEKWRASDYASSTPLREFPPDWGLRRLSTCNLACKEAASPPLPSLTPSPSDTLNLGLPSPNHPTTPYTLALINTGLYCKQQTNAQSKSTLYIKDDSHRTRPLYFHGKVG